MVIDTESTGVHTSGSIVVLVTARECRYRRMARARWLQVESTLTRDFFHEKKKNISICLGKKKYRRYGNWLI